LSEHGFLLTGGTLKHDLWLKSADDGRSRDRSELGMNFSLEAKAAALVNPASGIANDYLNHFNEILLIVENFPILLPEMVDEMMQWKPVSYREYFKNSPLPGGADALRIYDSLDENFRTDFESMVELLNGIAMGAIKVILTHRMPDGTIDPDAIGEACEEHSADLRAVLARAADLVNHGYAPPLERPQHMADRLLAHLQHKNAS
jgi:hypothetical protein